MTTPHPPQKSQETASFAHRLRGDWLVRALPLDWADQQYTPTPVTDWISVPECAHLQPILYPEQPYWGAHL
ncbi:MAG: hypothetical protein K8J31_12485, partial [Anaerolineae bacterium]|nr:hypothetical protein [Anaerolineae bacterium]